VLRGDLLDSWQQQLPPESPNYFLINIAPEQVTPLKAFLSEHQIVPESFYPIVRARLTQINGKVTEGNQDEALNRELNLTWQDKRPDHNPITAGTWPPKAGEVSMEEGLAKRLNIGLGDKVTFTGDTQDFSATVTSLRKVDWESLRPNFFFIFPAGALDGQPQSWLTSFRWENGNGMLTQLNREFPTVSLLDIGAILKQVGQVLEQVSRALEVMVVLVTLCGVLLLLAQVQVGMRQRHQELVVYRTLGPGNVCCALPCGASLPCWGWWRAWWRPLARKRRWRYFRPGSLTSRGSQTGGCGSRCLFAVRCCCRCAAAGSVRGC
jgi:putative ABC transport system permease protein